MAEMNNVLQLEGPLICDVRPLIVENVDKVITESANGKTETALRVTGIFQEAEIQNANSRVYPRSVLEQAVARIKPFVEARKVLGEFDHPPDAKIHLDRVSHLITKLWMEGNKVYGQAEVLEHTQFGQALKGLLKQNVTIGVSSRGIGDMVTESTGGKQFFRVLEGYNLITFDAVAEPSVPGTELTMMESRMRRQRDADNGLLVRKHIEHRLLGEMKKYIN